MTMALVALLTMTAVPAARAQSSNNALLRLLLILRDRGSITADEYEELRLAAGGSPSDAGRSDPVAEARSR